MRLERLGLLCPVCGEKMGVRSSRQVTDVLREVYAECAEHGGLGIKWLVEVTADLHNGSYEDGLHIQPSQRRPALLPIPRQDVRQTVIPGCEMPTRKGLAAGELRCPVCSGAMRHVRGEQVSAIERHVFSICFNPLCPGKFKTVACAAQVQYGDAPGIALPRWTGRQTQIQPQIDARQIGLPLPEGMTP